MGVSLAEGGNVSLKKGPRPDRGARGSGLGHPHDTSTLLWNDTGKAESRGQSFGQVRNTCIRVVNQAGGAQLAHYDLSEDASNETAMVFGELYRHGAERKSTPLERDTPQEWRASPPASA